MPRYNQFYATLADAVAADDEVFAAEAVRLHAEGQHDIAHALERLTTRNVNTQREENTVTTFNTSVCLCQRHNAEDSETYIAALTAEGAPFEGQEDALREFDVDKLKVLYDALVEPDEVADDEPPRPEENHRSHSRMFNAADVLPPTTTQVAVQRRNAELAARRAQAETRQHMRPRFAALDRTRSDEFEQIPTTTQVAIQRRRELGR